MEKGGGGGGGSASHRQPDNVETGWREGGEDVLSQSTIQIGRIVWGETSGGDSPSLLIEAQDRTEFTVCSGNHPIIPIKTP